MAPTFNINKSPKRLGLSRIGETYNPNRPQIDLSETFDFSFPTKSIYDINSPWTGLPRQPIVCDSPECCLPALPIPSELYIEIKGAGQYAPGEEGQLPEWQILTGTGGIRPEYPNTVVDWWGTGNCDGQEVSVHVVVGENIVPSGNAGYCCGAESPTVGILLNFYFGYPFGSFPSYYIYSPVLEDYEVFPQMEGGAMPDRWTCGKYCVPLDQLGAALDGMTFDLVYVAPNVTTPILVFTATIYTSIQEGASVSECNHVLVNGHGGEGFVACDDRIDCPSPSPSVSPSPSPSVEPSPGP